MKYPLASINLGSAKIHIFSGGDQHYFENKPIYQVVHLKKVDSTDSSQVLPGAEFRIYSDPDCKKPVEGLGILTSDENGVIRDAKGNDSFKLAGDTYYLKEIKAPEGYTLMKQVLVVKVDQNGVSVTTLSGESSTAASVSDNQTIIIRNSVISYELPNTGGTGTTMIYVAGGVLVAFAVVMFVMQKRKKS